MNSALIIMAKMPRAGAVKTRLQPFLSKDQCADFALALLRQTELTALSIRTEVIFLLAPFSENESFQQLLQKKHRVFPQKSVGDLGERMQSAFETVFATGVEQIVLVGTDCPRLNKDIIQNAFSSLEAGAEAVLGPTEDGGYYLIGLRKVVGGILEDVEWSTDQTFAQTKANLTRLDMRPELLPELYDIDRKQDLLRLANELKRDPSISSIMEGWIRDNDYLFRTSK